LEESHNSLQYPTRRTLQGEERKKIFKWEFGWQRMMPLHIDVRFRYDIKGHQDIASHHQFYQSITLLKLARDFA
jgi:hypothetical protein